MKMLFLRIPKYWRQICILLFLILFQEQGMAGDPWKAMQNKLREAGVIRIEKQQTSAQDPYKFRKTGAIRFEEHKASAQDPWERLQAIILPFSETEEIAALTDANAARKISEHLHRVLRPHVSHVYKASQRFNVPPEIIKAVILVESAGNPRAKARTSSAKGLMQTIDSTFKSARKGLMDKGIYIANTPYNAHASIMAGTWYLDRMFMRAVADKKPEVKNRNDFESWRLPLEYYYAGPIHGRKAKGIVVMYAGGKRVVINKPAYSNKVIKWAKIMATS